MGIDLPVYIGHGAIDRLVDYCRGRGFNRFMLVADQNTYPVLGQAVEQALKAAGNSVRSVVLTGDEIIADEYYLMQVLLKADKSEQVYIAVGSGTITDITRFCSHRQRTDFISVPTAPSVDGFTSVGSPLVVGRWKQTVQGQPPVAVFGDEHTLQNAPRAMIAAGFGDMLGKHTCLADWRIGHLVWDEPFDETVYERAWCSLGKVMDSAEQIGRGEEGGICAQMEGLIESGLNMVEVGSSRPAGGSEHHMSHLWEMKFLMEGRHAVFHGAKVGVATTFVAQRYAKVRSMSKTEAAERMQARPLPDREQEVERIKEAFGKMLGQSLTEQAPYLDMSPEAHRALQQRILDNWEGIQAAAQRVPEPARLVELLRTVGAPTEPGALGLSKDEVALAVVYAHYLRNRFTMLKLAHYLGI